MNEKNKPIRNDGSLNYNFNPLLQIKEYMEAIKDDVVSNLIKLKVPIDTEESRVDLFSGTGHRIKICIFLLGKDDNRYRRNHIEIEYDLSDLNRSWFVENIRSTQDVEFPHTRVLLWPSREGMSHISFEIRTGELQRVLFLEIIASFLKSK